MTDPLDQSIVELLHASSDDEETMRLPGIRDRSFGFHAQQAVEKLLKALIGGHGHRFRYTHDLAELMRSLYALGERMPLEVGLSDHLTNYAASGGTRSRRRSRFEHERIFNTRWRCCDYS